MFRTALPLSVADPSPMADCGGGSFVRGGSLLAVAGPGRCSPPLGGPRRGGRRRQPCRHNRRHPADPPPLRGARRIGRASPPTSSHPLPRKHPDSTCCLIPTRHRGEEGPEDITAEHATVRHCPSASATAGKSTSVPPPQIGPEHCQHSLPPPTTNARRTPVDDDESFFRDIIFFFC